MSRTPETAPRPAAELAPAQRPAPRPSWLRPTLLYATLVLALSWPLAAQLDTLLLGDYRHPGQRGDLFFQYSLQQQLRAGGLPTLARTPLLGYPDGLPLDPRVAFSAHLYLYLALMSVFDLLPARNIAALLFLLLNALAAHALARERLRREALAYLAGLVFAFGPFVFLKVQQGFVQKYCLFTIPLFVLFALRLTDPPPRGARPRRDQLTCAGLFALGALFYPPYAAFNLALALALLLAGGAPRHIAGRLRRLGPPLLAMAATLALIGWAIRDDPRAVPTAMDKWQHLGGYLHGLNPFRFAPYAGTMDFLGLPYLGELPLGMPLTLTLFALLAAFLGRGRARLWLALGLAALVLMLGPFWPGTGELPPGERVRLPFFYLAQAPGGNLLHFPIRLFPWLLLGLILAGGRGLLWLEARLRQRPRLSRLAPLLVPAALLTSVAEQRLVFPEYTRFVPSQPRLTPFLARARAGRFAALYLLPERPIVPNAYLYSAVMARKPLVNGYIGQPAAVPLPRPEAGEPERRAFLRRLARLDVGVLVLHLAQLPDPPELPPELPPGPLPRGLTPEPYAWLEAHCGPAEYFAEERLIVFGVPGRRASANSGGER